MDTDTSVGALLFWAMTVLACIERVLLEEGFSPWHCRVSDRPSALIKQSNAALTLLALRNVLRAAEWCARDLQRPTRGPMDWIAEFHRMVPDLINARDAAAAGQFQPSLGVAASRHRGRPARPALPRPPAHR
jgi:hypothetical protein